MSTDVRCLKWGSLLTPSSRRMWRRLFSIAILVGIDLDASSVPRIFVIADVTLGDSLATSAFSSGEEKLAKHFSTYRLVWKASTLASLSIHTRYRTRQTNQVQQPTVIVRIEELALLQQLECESAATAVQHQRLQHFIRCIAKKAPVCREDSRKHNRHDDICRQVNELISWPLSSACWRNCRVPKNGARRCLSKKAKSLTSKSESRASEAV